MKSKTTQFKKIIQIYNNSFLLQNSFNTITTKDSNVENILIPKKQTSIKNWSCICGLPVFYKDAYYHYYQGQILQYKNHNFLNQTIRIQVNVSHMDFFLSIPTQLPSLALDIAFRRN